MTDKFLALMFLGLLACPVVGWVLLNGVIGR
jgi:hypothetical protein